MSGNERERLEIMDKKKRLRLTLSKHAELQEEGNVVELHGFFGPAHASSPSHQRLNFTKTAFRRAPAEHQRKVNRICVHAVQDHSGVLLGNDGFIEDNTGGGLQSALSDLLTRADASLQKVAEER